MLNVYLTFDTEIWCDGWDNLDASFADAFKRYVYGPTPQGDGALPLIIDILNRHGLTGVFFVEPLFATRFGKQPLRELVGLLRDGGQEVQLHLHTEWADEADPPLLGVTQKHQHLALFDGEQQRELFRLGLELLAEAGASGINAFRAGNYSFNEHTLGALAANGIHIDSSYNPGSRRGGRHPPGSVSDSQASERDGVMVYPVTTFDDGFQKRPRAVQVTSCSWGETQHVLQSALEAGWESVVIVSHNFELMNPAKTRRDPIAVRRFEKLCAFLGQNRDRFNCRGFKDLDPTPFAGEAARLRSNRARTLVRMGEQALRRLYE